ncbi:MAG: 4-hydroxythreonine-4-phosphate dehydrogenase PdxA [Candidatus Krumholzibacteriota bacterium]|nr:4-hydroxythreonine-4-phosphate dehydrogenase PdxA [Candidatus Krumholzibacteriota bacterium]
MSEVKPRLALTIGDPSGIGPELAAKLLKRGKLDSTETWLIGSAHSLQKETGRELYEKLEKMTPEEAGSGAAPSSFPVIIDVAGGIEPVPGRASAESGRISGRAVETAAEMAKKGIVDGIVTGPISKEALNLGGYHFKGHTAMLSEIMNAPDCQMMMVAGKLRILILTRDIPLSEVPLMVTREKISSGVRETCRSLREDFGIEAPVIRVAALNPHSGDGGVNGREEIEVISPAIEMLRAEGIDVSGPVPADTLFYDWANSGVDAFIALYHDQGMIPFKISGFKNGVNMTIGLPVLRTSVCHGTAYDIAGKGIADPASLEAAVSLASGCLASGRKKIGVR